MPSQNKLIKQGIQYTDKLFDEISKRLEAGVKSSDSLESFLDKYHKAFSDKGNPLLSLNYEGTLLNLILAETNNHKFSRPAQKELVRVTIESQVGELIRDVGEDIKQSVRDIVKEGYNNNLSQYEIADNISERISTIKNTRANVIARTEIARTSTISDYIINKERGATHFYVECRNTACPICKEAWHKGWSEANDGSFMPSDKSAGGRGWIGDKVYSMSDTGKLPPIHPNCRCVPYFITEDEIPEGNVIVQDNVTTKDIIVNNESKLEKSRKKFDKTTYKKDTDRLLELKQDELQNKIKFPKLLKEAVKYWGGTGHKMINSLIYHRGFIARLPETDPTVKMINKMIERLDEAIDMSPRLAQDTILYRQGHFSEKLEVGKVYGFKGYTSTSYDEDVINSFSGEGRYKIEIYAPAGTKGIRLNDTFDAATDEREFLIGRKQKFEVLEVDPENKTAKIRLIVED